MGKSKEKCWIPEHELESLARCLLPDIQAYFETEAGQQEFASWQEQQKEETPKKE